MTQKIYINHLVSEMAKKSYTGLNIQYPITQLILSGEKIVETRTYPLPNKYLNTDLLIIETPGKNRNFKSRIIGIVQFSENIKYKSLKDFRSDFSRHRVSSGSKWDWKDEKPKWGWKISKLKILDKRTTFSKTKGIVFTKNITL